MTLRVNAAAQIDAASYLAELKPSALRHARRSFGAAAGAARPVQQLPGFADGASLGAGRRRADGRAAAARRPAAPGGPVGAAPLRVLDACAAPGGKTAHLLELAAPVPSTSPRWKSMPCAAAASTRPWCARLQAKVVVADAAAPPSGGTARRSTPSCSMRRAPPRASCAATPTCAGCAARATPPSSRPSRPRCWRALAAGEARRPSSLLHLLRVPRRRFATN
jgi:hypothetical protein